MLFDVEPTTISGRPALRVRGELDIATVPALAAVVASQLRSAPRELVIDLTETTFIDSSGARQLTHAARQAAEEGVALQVLCPATNRAVRLVFDLLELGRVVPIVESLPRVHGEVGP